MSATGWAIAAAFRGLGLADEDRPTERVLCRNAQDLLHAFGERRDIIHEQRAIGKELYALGMFNPSRAASASSAERGQEIVRLGD